MSLLNWTFQMPSTAFNAGGCLPWFLTTIQLLALPSCLQLTFDAVLRRFQNYTVYPKKARNNGDPLGPFLFCLSINKLLSSLMFSLPLAYMDGVTLGGPIDVVGMDVERIVNEGSAIGLHLNSSMCEIIHSEQLAIDHSTLTCSFIFP